MIRVAHFMPSIGFIEYHLSPSIFKVVYSQEYLYFRTVYDKLQLDFPYTILINNLYDIVAGGNYQALGCLIDRAPENVKAFFQRTVRVVVSINRNIQLYADRAVSHAHSNRENHILPHKRSGSRGNSPLTGLVNSVQSNFHNHGLRMALKP
jgi:hypothetical protein